jgi:hypothetical protein
MRWRRAPATKETYPRCSVNLHPRVIIHVAELQERTYSGGINPPIMVDDPCSVGQVCPQTLRNDQLAALPIQTSTREDQLRVVIEILHVGVGKFGALPAHSLPCIEEGDPSTNKPHECAHIGNRCRAVDWRVDLRYQTWMPRQTMKLPASSAPAHAEAAQPGFGHCSPAPTREPASSVWYVRAGFRMATTVNSVPGPRRRSRSFYPL